MYKMFKYYHIYLFAFFFLGMGLIGCEKSDEISLPKRGEYELTLNLNCSILQTRANQGDVVDFNENKINTLDCFFYKASSNLDAQAVHKVSFTDLKGEKSVEVKITFTKEEIKELFGTDGTSCIIYAIANCPATVHIDDTKTSVNQLKNLPISNEGFISTEPQPSFVMDSEGTEIINLDRSTRKLTGTINLERAAVKITLTVTSINNVVENEGTPEEITWTADPTAITAQLHYGVKNSYINTKTYPYKANQDDYFSFTDDNPVSYHPNTQTISGKESKVYEQNVPFYSYSNKWEKLKDKEPYILLVVPWVKSTESGKFYPCYYQIPVNSQGSELIRNCHYKINLSVSTLGSFKKEEAKPLNPSYVIVDWGTNTIDASMGSLRYLMVDHTSYILRNHNILEIDYASSHPIEINKDDKNKPHVTQTNLKDVTAKEVDITSGFDISINAEKKCIVYKKTLNNTFQDALFDFTPYTIKFRVQHTDNTDYYEDIELKQYPAIYAEAFTNSDYTEKTNNNNKHNGYVFVNGYQRYGPEDGQDNFCSAEGFYEDNNASPNMFVFTVSSVQGTSYRIGDPREKIVNHDFINKTKWCEGSSLIDGVYNGGKRRLENYYATDERDETRNVIAPKFRIASAYSVMYTTAEGAKSRDILKKRCASYQEDGYPAGRWRLPTQAEFEFIMSQVDKGKLPQLYIKDRGYWCAHGFGEPQGNGKIKMTYEKSSSEGHSTRCVYDEWYWTDKIPDEHKGEFVWGDRPRK